MSEEVDEWDIEGGEGGFQGVIANARFGTMENYANGKQALFMFDLLRPSNGTVIGDSERPRIYSVGKGWDIVNGGDRIEGEYDKISGRTGYGQFIARAVKDLGVKMADRGKSPREAAVWNGLCFRWNNEKYETVGGEEKDRLMPQEYIQEIDLAGYGSAGTIGGGAGKGKKLEEAAEAEITDEIRAELTEIALNVDGDDTIEQAGKLKAFTRNAIRLESVKGNTKLKTYLMNRKHAEQFYSEVTQ